VNRNFRPISALPLFLLLSCAFALPLWSSLAHSAVPTTLGFDKGYSIDPNGRV
jgi:hypothetical protein